MTGGMNSVSLAIAVVTYVGVAIGGIPGLALDRTGIALLGAIAMVASGVLPLQAAVASIDVPTILLLYGLMVLSSQFRLGGFYTRAAVRLTALIDNPARFLFAIMSASAILSAVLAGLIGALLARGVDIRHLFVLTTVSGILSNLVSNVPATMLLTRFLDPAQHAQWYVLAVSSTFAGNLITIGSIANLITFEQARTCGVEIGFREHARVGIPVTLASFAIVFGWIALVS